MYATMEEQRLILIKLRKTKFHHMKKEVIAMFTDVTDFDNKHKFTSASELKLLLSTQCQMCIYKRQKIYYYCIYIWACINIIWGVGLRLTCA